MRQLRRKKNRIMEENIAGALKEKGKERNPKNSRMPQHGSQLNVQAIQAAIRGRVVWSSRGSGPISDGILRSIGTLTGDFNCVT